MIADDILTYAQSKNNRDQILSKVFQRLWKYSIGQNICNQHRTMLKSVPNLTCLKNETNYTTTANSSGVWSHSMP